MALLPENIRFHTIEFSNAWEEVDRQFQIAGEFGGGGLASLPKNTRAEKKARREAIQSAGQPIFDAVNAHNGAHRKAEEAGAKVFRFEKMAQEAKDNIFLGENAGSVVDAKVEEVKAILEQAETDVLTTNNALPSRLQSSMHLRAEV